MVFESIQRYERQKYIFTLQLLPKIKSQNSKKKLIVAYHIKKFWSDNWHFILNQKKIMFWLTTHMAENIGNLNR